MDLKEKLIASFPALEKETTDKQIKTMRKEALANFEAKGFPTKKDEAWKYTSLRPVLKEDYSLTDNGAQTVSREELDHYVIDQLEAHTMVFIDGKFAPQFSDPITDQITVIELSEARQNDAYKSVIEQHFNQIAPKEMSLNSLNTAFFKEGVFVHVSKSVAAEKPVQMIYFTTGSEKAMLSQPRNLVVAENNAQVKLIERHQSLTDNPALTNTLTEIFVGRDAMVDYYKIQNDKYKASLIDNTFIDQMDNSDFSCHTFSFGGKLTRNTIKAFQKGEHINSTFKGITLLEDKQHVDHNTLVHHQQPNCESHQDYKGVFDDRSVGVFDGYIKVDKIAQKTDGYQKSDNLLISDKAKANAKPQLEIYADDVICSHGCTVGQLDEEALFYLKSRGIPDKEARATLMYAFTSKVLESVKIPQLRRRIDRQIAAKLGVNLGYEL